MTDLAQTLASYERAVAREFFATFLGPIRELKEVHAKFTRERVQVWPIGDRKSATPHITALTFTGINYSVNTTKEGRLYVRFVANGGNWDVNFYTATGASGLVAHVTNLAASGTAALVADNSSGLGGSITLGATIAADATDLHQVLIVVDYPARLPLVFTGTSGIDDDRTSRDAASNAYTAAAAALRTAISALATGAQRWATARLPDNPVARLNAFCQTNESSLSTDVAVVDTASGNVSRKRGGLLPILSDDMADNTGGGEIDILRRVIAAGAGSFDGGNSGKGTLASHTPREKTPVGLWTFQCVKGDDTGDLGREEFAGTFAATDGSGEGFSFEGLRVERDWSGPRGIGSVRLRRTYAKTGDGSNLNLAAVTTSLFDGENARNTDHGILYWSIVSNASNWDISFFSSSARTATTLVAKATNVATGAAFSAVPQNGSGLTVNWTVGSGPTTATTGTVTCQPFLVENAGGFPDKFTITTSLTGTGGVTQRLLAEVFDADLNSDTSGSEALPDTWTIAGTFFPYLTLDI